MVARLLFLAFLFCATNCIASGKFNRIGYLEDKFGFGEVNILKASPAFFGRWAPRGMILGYETGAGVNYWSLNFTLKYFSGIDTSETFTPIDEHFKLELHPRFWVSDFMSGFFFSPILGVYNTGDITGGIAFGGQIYLTERLLLDAYSGVQTSTPTEHLNDTIFLKFGMNLGFQISK